MNKIKIKHYSNKEDFAASYFCKILWDEASATDEKEGKERLADYFEIDRNKIKSIKNINNEIRENLFINYKTEKEINSFKKIESKFEEVSISVMEKVVKNINLYLEKYIEVFENMFSKSDLFKDLEISFIKSIDINFSHGFYFRFLPNKIFVFVSSDSKMSNKDVLGTTKTVLHEFTHILLNQNNLFQELFKKEWIEKYKNIKGQVFRSRIEEIIVNNNINGNRDYGFIYKDIGLPNNDEKEKEILSKNMYKVITYDFLENLKDSKDKNKLEKELSIFIEKLVKQGLFKDQELK